MESNQVTSEASWHKRLSTLQGVGELFGQGAEERFKDLSDFVQDLATADLPKAIVELEQIQAQNPTATGRYLQLHLLQRWAESDLHPAIAWITQLPAGDERLEAIAAAAGTWAKADFGEAAHWAGQLPGSADRRIAQETVAAEAAYAKPVEALKLACALMPSSTRDEIIKRATATWATAAPEDAIAWAKQITDQTLRQQVTAGIAAAWGESNPVAAGYLAIESLPPGPLQNKTVMAIVQRWMQSDVKGATAWVNQFPAGELRQTAAAMMNDFATRRQRFAPQTP